MFTLAASQAKQNSDALIGQLAQSPMAVQSVPNPRQIARLAQQQCELHRLLRHQQLATDLLRAPIEIQQQSLQAAQKMVERWQAEQLCSADYIQRWRHWLALPLPELARLMCSEAEGWGPAMRQNSPFTANSPPLSTS